LRGLWKNSLFIFRKAVAANFEPLERRFRLFLRRGILKPFLK